MQIKYLVVHHAGGFKNDPSASSANLTLEQINQAHKSRWPDFPSKLNPLLHVGYNIVIFKDRWVQTRYIGEETAAVKKYNNEAISILIVGNFMNFLGKPIDQMTEFQKTKLVELMLAIVEGRPQSVGLRTLPSVKINIPFYRIVPHRFLGPTECYGTFLSDTWARDQVLLHISHKISLLQEILGKLFLMSQKAKFGLSNTFSHYGSIPYSCFDSDMRG